MDFKKLIESEEYDFLRTEDNLNNNIMFLVAAGSHGYGLATEDSDIDIRGITENTRSELIGIRKMMTFTEKETDTVIYSFMKFIKMAINSNPSAIELLGFDRDNYLLISDLGKEILYNYKMFLSKELATTFMGFADSEILKMKKYCRTIREAGDDGHFLEKKVNKKAANALRLHILCADILKTGKINCHLNDKDREMLLEVRSGLYFSDTSKFIDNEFYELKKKLKEKVRFAEDTCSLPPVPDITRIERFTENINMKILTR